MAKRLFLLISVVIACFAFTACRRANEAPRTVIMPTAEPTATPLPPVETVPALGTSGNPYLFLFVVDDAEESAPIAEELTSVLNENGEISFLVSVTESYSEAREALCSGSAVMVSLDAFSYLATGDPPCGQVVSVVERDGLTASQGQFVGYDVFAPRMYRDEFCRVDAFSLNTWIMPRLFLLAEDVDPFLNLADVIDKGDDRAVIEGVLSRECGMGAVSVGAEVANADLPGISNLAIIQVLPSVPYDLVVRSDRLEGYALGLTEDLYRSEQALFISLLGVDDLVPAGDLDFSELRDFILAAGVDITSLGG